MGSPLVLDVGHNSGPTHIYRYYNPKFQCCLNTTQAALAQLRLFEAAQIAQLLVDFWSELVDFWFGLTRRREPKAGPDKAANGGAKRESYWPSLLDIRSRFQTAQALLSRLSHFRLHLIQTLLQLLNRLSSVLIRVCERRFVVYVLKSI
jgi:hypothetical protein